MKKYLMTLRVEVTCPEDSSHPENTISRQTVLKSLLRVGRGSFGYAICDPNNSGALTASMVIIDAEFDPCPCCGGTK